MAANPKSVLFIYSRTKGYSGQQAATDLVIEGLTAQGYQVLQGVTWAFDRDIWGRWAYPFLLCQYAFAWIKSLCFGLRASAVCLNLGQTRISMIRDGIPFRLLAYLRPRTRRIVSLHGSVFMSWQPDQPIAYHFLKVLKHAQKVTVLGPNQRSHLIHLGLPAERVEILCNTCDIPVVTQEQIDAKFQKQETTEPFEILFLSNLIVSKGYLVYLNALKRLSQRDDLPPISAVLCGPLKISEFSSNYENEKQARNDIEKIIDEAQQSGQVTIKWIEGARGQAKLELYRHSHLFVFPSQYPVEAQPLVLLEAMASGCAIVTSTVGEIPYTMGKVGLLLDEVTEDSVAEAIARLIREHSETASMATAALERYRKYYAIEAHMKQWRHLLEDHCP